MKCLSGYSTARKISFDILWLRITHKVVLLCVISAIICTSVFTKGYQKHNDVETIELSIIKGVIYTDVPEYNRTWDPTDYVKPPEAKNSFLITTNLLVTRKQKQGICEEDPDILDGRCENNPSHCQPGRHVIGGHGRMTGRCIESSRQENASVCQIRAWCEVEDTGPSVETHAILSGVENITVTIINWISFPLFKAKRANIESTHDESYLKRCRNDEQNDLCPVFTVGQMVRRAGENVQSMAKEGGVIAIIISWYCNLDPPHGISSCRPKYTFRRIDDKTVPFHEGFHVRYANYYYENDIEMRDLFKATGIHFTVKVMGQAGRFDFGQFVRAIGSYLGFFGIVGIICGILLKCIDKDASDQITTPAEDL